MAQVTKMLAVGMVAATLMVVVLAIYGAETQRADAATINYGAGCATMLEYPTDHNCEVYAIMRWRYFHWSNDRYTIRYHWLKTHGYTWRASVMQKAARYTCQGTLYEDFSCSGPKRTSSTIRAEDGSTVPASFYDHTDYRPVKAAIG